MPKSTIAKMYDDAVDAVTGLVKSKKKSKKTVKPRVSKAKPKTIKAATKIKRAKKK